MGSLGMGATLISRGSDVPEGRRRHDRRGSLLGEPDDLSSPYHLPTLCFSSRELDECQRAQEQENMDENRSRAQLANIKAKHVRTPCWLLPCPLHGAFGSEASQAMGPLLQSPGGVDRPCALPSNGPQRAPFVLRCPLADGGFYERASVLTGWPSLLPTKLGATRKSCCLLRKVVSREMCWVFPTTNQHSFLPSYVGLRWPTAAFLNFGRLKIQGWLGNSGN